MLSILLDVLYPRRCPVCDEIVLPKGRLICPLCEEKLSFVKAPVCHCCGKEVESSEEEYCPDCRKYPHSFTGGMALLNYNKTVQRSLLKFKYSNKREYADYYIEELVRRYLPKLERVQADMIVPVPMHWRARAKRGYNQAEVLAGKLSAYMEIPVNTRLLYRTRYTPAQKTLGSKARLHNLEKSIEPRMRLTGYPTILLADDIYTTGSTLEATTRALKKAGAGKVVPVVVAIGKN